MLVTEGLLLFIHVKCLCIYVCYPYTTGGMKFVRVYLFGILVCINGVNGEFQL